MGIIKIYHKSSKPKKKPGWKQLEAEHQAWLNQVNELTLFGARTHEPIGFKRIDPVVNAPVLTLNKAHSAQSLKTFGGTGTKQVNRPDILYKDEPELLERELRARARRFMTAPIYNKGPAQFISEETVITELKSGTLRRR